MKKFFMLPSFLIKYVNIKELCIVLSLIYLGHSLPAQDCNYDNPIPPISGICQSSGGHIRGVFLSSYCGAVAGSGHVSNFGHLVEDMTIYFTGNLIIDDYITFRRCTFLFADNIGIKSDKHWMYLPPFNINVSPHSSFDNCFLGSCGSGKWAGIQGTFNHNDAGGFKFENNCTISNAKIGVDIVMNGGSFEFSNVSFENCDAGIYIDGSFSNGPDKLAVSNCIFNNVKFGIKGTKYDKRFQISSTNTFTNCDLAISTEDVGGTTIKNQIISGGINGIKIDNPMVSTSPGIDLAGNNISVLNSAIFVNNVNKPTTLLFSNNILQGSNKVRSTGINIENSDMQNNIIISSSKPIAGFNYGVRINNVLHNSFFLSQSNLFDNKHPINYLNNTNSSYFRIIGGNWDFNGNSYIHDIQNGGKIEDLNISNSPIFITASKDMFFNDNTFDWWNTPTGENAILKLSNSSVSSFCCNTFNGQGNNLYLLGTNVNTKLRGSTFINGSLTFDNTMIGLNEHAGNRWKESTTGRLIGGLPSDNQFLVNYNESNSTLGDIKPSIIEPSAIANEWFSDDGRESLGCYPGCGLPGNLPVNPDEDDVFLLPDTTNLFGNCYPLDLDTDGDGICDTSDPDAHDPCIPIMADLDNDGICDSMDPDPNNPCFPIEIDTDQDGICDGSDPDPYDFCIPNGIDTDGDGICDLIDLDPFNPISNDPVVDNCWWLNDINGDRIKSLGYHQLGLKYTIQDLEWIAQYFTGNELAGFESLHYVESMTFLYEVLHTSPYYRMISPILNNKYIELCESNSSIPYFAKISSDLKTVAKFSKYNNFSYTKKQVYLNKIDKLISKLNNNNSVDSLHLINLKELRNSIISQMELIIEQQKLSKLSKLEQLSLDIQNLPEDFPVYNALKDFYEIYFQHSILKNPLSENQISILTEMSKLCPLIYGEAVHHARALLVGSNLNEFEDFSDECLNVTWNAKKVDFPNLNNIEISPNPTNDWVRLTSNFNILKVDVVNTHGVIIFSKNLDSKEIQVNIGSLPPAMYYLNIHTADGHRVIHKVIKI